MNKFPQEQDLQLNISSDPEEAFSLEEIMREFGGWSAEEEHAQETSDTGISGEVPETDVKSPEDTEIMRIAAAAEPAFTANKPVDLSGDTIRFRPVEEPEVFSVPVSRRQPAEMPEEPPAAEPDWRQRWESRKAQKREAGRQRRLLSQRKKALRAERRAQRRDEPEIVYPSPEDACVAYAKGGTLRIRLLLCAVLCILSGALLVLSVWTVGKLDLTGYRHLFSIAMLAVLLLQSLLSAEVFIRGVYAVLKFRFDLLSMLVAAVLVTGADAFFAIPQGRTPFCTVISLSLLIALRSIVLEKKAKWRTLKTVLSMDEPVAAVKEEKVWHDLDCILRQRGSLDDFTAMLETPDAATKVMRAYAPLAAAGTMALAVYAAYEGDGDFLWAWAGLLTAALPTGGFLACCRPFCLLAKRLSKVGAAVCGWRGAKILSGEGGVVITDKDLFPASNISMNGMKMYSDMPVKQVVSYAAAVVAAAGNGLLPLFEEIMENENARPYSVDTFRQYEGGGLGAEIHGDVVLMGSLAFMRLMEIQVPESIRVQSAVYISVNRELVGVFALNYAPFSGVRSSLASILHNPGLTPILATRDFMITPGLVKKRYRIPADRLEFPVVAERIWLSDPDTGKNGRQGALMTGDSFVSLAAAVTGARILRRSVHSAVSVSVATGMMGMGLLFLMTYLGATEAASAINLLLYQLLWLLPTGLITGIVGKS